MGSERRPNGATWLSVLGVALAAIVLVGTAGIAEGAPSGDGATSAARTAGAAATQLWAAAQLASAAAPAGFVQRAGRHLVVDGQPWAFVGFDDFTLTSLLGDPFTCGTIHTVDDVDAEFAAFEQHGVTVVRTWFFESYIDNASGWRAFDTVLAAAARHHVRVIPTLANQWGDCENADHTPSQHRTIAWYSGGYATSHDYGMSRTYLEYVRAVVARYRDDPTVAFWQLMNEAEAGPAGNTPCDETAAAHALRSFADTMTAAIREVDAHHLVSLGTIGSGQCGTSGTDYSYVHAGAVDLCEYHDYAPGAVNGDTWNGVKVDLYTCAQLGKPTFAGEVGIDASVNSDGTSTGTVTPQTLQQRANLFSAKMRGQFSVGACGFLIWSAAAGMSTGYDVGATDPVYAALQQASQTLTTRAALYASLVAGTPPPGDR